MRNFKINTSSILIITFIAAISLASGVLPASATDDYAEATGRECIVCHISASGGGGLTAAGELYSEDPDSWDAPEPSDGTKPIYLKLIHTAVLYAHIFFGIIWIGTILYVHIVLKPRYAMGGLPKGELRLAWTSIPVLALTGILLTLWRVQLSPGLFTTSFGKLLILKIVVFTAMVGSAAFVTRFVGPRLKALAEDHHVDEEYTAKTRFNADNLDDYDGMDGRTALIAANGGVYDVSPSQMWQNGLHAGRHRAGQDLSEYLEMAPHGDEVFEHFDRIGDFVEERTDKPVIIKIFVMNAYFNLFGCFLIILVLVLWRW